MKKIALLIAIAIICGGWGGVASAEDYFLETPANLNIQHAGYNLTTGFKASSDKRIILTVTAKSSNWKLVSNHGEELTYALASRDNGGPVTEWVFTPEELNKAGGTKKDMYVVLPDYSAGRPGSYTTDLTFSVTQEDLVVDLSTLTGDYEAKDGNILTGTLGTEGYKITVAAGATITLENATITSIPNDKSHNWAGITPLGDATIILEGTNAVKGGYEDNPGILVVSDDAHPNSTLTIKGNGKLTATSGGSGNNMYGAGIGGGNEISCGNIVIESGDITATGGQAAAGIGSGFQASCGTITISGGTVTANGGSGGAGIGSGYNYASCGTITISGGTVKAKGGTSGAGIGSGSEGASCGTITISGGTVEATGGKYAAGIGSGYYYAKCEGITITSTVTRVTATKGENATNSIGAGNNDSTCGTVTIQDASKVTQN